MNKNENSITKKKYRYIKCYTIGIKKKLLELKAKSLILCSFSFNNKVSLKYLMSLTKFNLDKRFLVCHEDRNILNIKNSTKFKSKFRNHKLYYHGMLIASLLLSNLKSNFSLFSVFKKIAKLQLTGNIAIKRDSVCFQLKGNLFSIHTFIKFFI